MPQLVSATAILVVACSYPFLTATAASMAPMIAQSASPATASSKTERHLRNIRKLTSGGENAEAYFSADGTRLVYQSTRPEYPCDQIYTMKIDGSEQRRVSTGTGRTTCGYFYPAGDEILFASTHESGAACPPHPSFERGYVWPIYASYDIYRAKADGTNLRPLTRTPGYDAEATIAPDGLITFTSVRDGDMEIYTMKADGSDVRRLTNRPGPDGGPFFSFDGKRIAFRSRPLEAGKELDEYRALLKEGLWRPTQLELFVMNRDGSALRQLTTLGGANFAPSWHPDGKRLVFASNLQDPKGRDFDVYLINVDGTGLERLTFSETFDGFPMFSPDGKHLVFASNRQAAAEGETNVFIAEWWNRSRVRGFAGSRFAGSRVRPEVLEKQPATAPASPTRTKERDMHTSLTELLRLTSPPVAITFLESAPANVPHVSAVEPAGCGYWRRAAEGEVFYTSADDHKRCPVGAHTHNVSLSPAEQQELMGLVQTMVGLPYLKMEEVPQIPTRKTPMQIAVYAPLEASPAPPEVVLVRGNAQQLMLLAEAAQAAGISGTGVTMGRPTCAVLPEAINTDRTAASFGCVGNRVYTGAAETDAYFAIPGSQLAPLEASLAVIVRANQELAKFHQARAAANS